MVIFGAIALVGVIALWHYVCTTLAVAVGPDQAHLLLAGLIGVVLLILEWPARGRADESRDWFGAATLVCALVGAIVIKLLAERLSADVALALGMVCLVTWWIGAFVFCFGRDAFRGAKFPLLLFYGMVPIPAWILSQLVYWLQVGTAWTVWFLFRIAFFPATRHDLIISIPGLTIGISQECSSIRSSLILIVVSLLLAHLLLSSIWRKWLVFLAVIPMCVLKNAIRVFVLGFLTTRVDQTFISGRLHREGGIIYLALAILMVMAVIFVLRSREVPSSPATLESSGSLSL